MVTIRVSWESRQPPLTPCACLARGAAARALGRALLDGDPTRLAQVAVCAGEDVLVVLAPSEHLPWVNGVVYLGRDDAAPGLLLPTSQQPNVPIDLFSRALAARLPAARPCAALPDHDGALLVVSVARPTPVVATALETWMETIP